MARTIRTTLHETTTRRPHQRRTIRTRPKVIRTEAATRRTIVARWWAVRAHLGEAAARRARQRWAVRARHQVVGANTTAQRGIRPSRREASARGRPRQRWAVRALGRVVVRGAGVRRFVGAGHQPVRTGLRQRLVQARWRALAARGRAVQQPGLEARVVRPGRGERSARRTFAARRRAGFGTGARRRA
ncbi:hypothetical protein ABT324_33275, partial [Saccharopolyspora sp. NPDC000359]|uniref:hypothetical protein n=1 Tax=Saccharopolyspora sp. NPDC000359 TaxID=3154251 RepID=UPI00331B4411